MNSELCTTCVLTITKINLDLFEHYFPIFFVHTAFKDNIKAVHVLGLIVRDLSTGGSPGTDELLSQELKLQILSDMLEREQSELINAAMDVVSNVSHKLYMLVNIAGYPNNVVSL
jgi:hypothetical protein